MKNISSPHLATLRRRAKKPSRRVPIYTWSSREPVYVRPDAKSFVVLAIHNDAPRSETVFATVTSRETIYEIEINDAYTANSKNRTAILQFDVILRSYFPLCFLLSS